MKAFNKTTRKVGFTKTFLNLVTIATESTMYVKTVYEMKKEEKNIRLT